MRDRQSEAELRKKREAEEEAELVKLAAENAALEEAAFGGNFVDGELTSGDSLPCVGHAAGLQNPLELAILAKSAMNDVENQIDAWRQLKVGSVDIDLHNVDPEASQGCRHASAGSERDGPLRTGAAHENGDSFSRK